MCGPRTQTLLRAGLRPGRGDEAAAFHHRHLAGQLGGGAVRGLYQYLITDRLIP